MSTSNRFLTTSTQQNPQAQAKDHQAFDSFQAASTVGYSGIECPSNSMTNPTTCNFRHSHAAPSAPMLQHDMNPGIHSQQDAADVVLPRLCTIKTVAPVRTTSSRIKECCHCGKTEEKQWRRYTAVPQEDMRPLCNRCFMWRRNHGGSASFRQDFLPSADILLASSTPRCRAARGHFCRDSISKKPGFGSSRSRFHSGGGGRSTSDDCQGLDLAPATPDFLDSMMPAGMQFNSTATAGPDASTGAARATWQTHCATNHGTAMYGDGSAWLGMSQQVPGQRFNILDQSVLQPLASAVATAAVALFPGTTGTTAARLPPETGNSSPYKQSPMKSHLGVRKSLSKSPLNKPTARHAVYSSFPSTPTHHQDSSEEHLWGVQAEGQQSYKEGASSGGCAPAGHLSRVSAGLPADGCSPAMRDSEVTQAAKVLAELMRMQSLPSAASLDVSGCCMQTSQQGLSVSAGGPGAANDSGASDSWTQLPEILPLHTGILQPETPTYAAVGARAANRLSSSDMAALLHAVGGLHWGDGITAASCAEHDVSHIDVAGNRATGVTGALATATAGTECGGGTLTLAEALGQNTCIALSAATAGGSAAAAGVSTIELPVQPDVLQVYVAAMLSGIPANMSDMSSKQDSYGAVQQQLQFAPELLKMLRMICSEQ